ncbi:MAG TPA: hypothetical protein VNM36_00980 [Gemmatimonadaceae bacterium]|jgi:hypothetical protein|nr:hypothetical protein [Gemmatimonadaceae bacterium]
MATVTRVRWTRMAALLCALGCRDVQGGLSPADQITVLRYLDCLDCIVALDSVRALALRQPDATVDSLNSALILGPPPGVVTAAESVLAIGYVRDSAWRLTRGLKPLEQRAIYISDARQGFVDAYQARGAMGMGWIRSQRARAYLDSALTRPLRAPVLRAVRYARDSLPPQPP